MKTQRRFASSTIFFLLLMMPLIGFTNTSFGGSSELEVAESAAHAFDQGEYVEAVRLYEELIGAGKINGHLFYNLGNAYYRSGKNGQAAAALLAARQYLPRDPDVRANLKHVISKINDKLDPSLPSGLWRSLTFWLDIATARELASLASLFAAAAGLVWSVGLFFRAGYLKGLSLAGGVAAVLLALAGYSSSVLGERWGAVVAETASVMSQPSKNAAVFVLREGAPFVVAAESPGWYKITLSDGKTGWVAASDVRAF